jgi:hypothetical protein
LLGGGDARRRDCNREEQRSQEKKTAERAKNLCMGIAVHAEHAVNENSWIA